MSRTERGICFVLGAAFLAAGVLKMLDPHGFAVTLTRLRTMPLSWVGPTAVLLPGIELVSALALFVPGYRRDALRLQLALLVGFSSILAAALLRGLGGSCGCYGSGDGFWSRMDVALARNAVLLGLETALLWRRPAASTSPASPASRA